ncbi:ras-related protein rab11 [Anaeramoeba ignava]|uniref:Ras-related protein rab11 n=1 Tax=Anaeramoeba ignava TaxID=1746090 RepID=A0A9Q0L8B3_ANAIG|nr:ras-related protein rab11 [Anaeramoeba ignava]
MIAYETQWDYLFKILLIGDSGVGKTNLLTRFCQNTFDQDSKSTIGVEFSTKIIDVGQYIIKAQLWDTAGQERYNAVTKSYFRGAVGAFIVYDITSFVSFQNVTKWLNLVREFSNPNTQIFLIGNKSDLNHLRQVTQQDAKKFASQNDIFFQETSALDGSNVEKSFLILSEKILQNLVTSKQSPNNPQNFLVRFDEKFIQENKEKNSQKKKKSNCC